MSASEIILERMPKTSFRRSMKTLLKYKKEWINGEKKCMWMGHLNITKFYVNSPQINLDIQCNLNKNSIESFKELNKLILTFIQKNRGLWISQFWKIKAEWELALPDIKTYYKTKVMKIEWFYMGADWYTNRPE